jgi:hypothetical protein
VLAACAGASPSGSPPLSASAPPPDPPSDIVTPDAPPPPLPDPIIPVLANPPKDCTLPAVFAQMATSLSPTDCGILKIRSSDATRQQALDCMIAAISEDRPFVFVENLQGIDSYVAAGLTARRETGAGLVTYLGRYDSDPCGGGCFDKGGAFTAPCTPTITHRAAADCPHSLLDCITCSGNTPGQRCTQGP